MTSAALSGAAGEESWKGRSPELEDPLNRYVYHPLARRLARLLQPTPVTPNAVSAMSGAMVCAAAAFYSLGSWPLGVLAGFACHLAWHVFDGADGDLARLTGKASPIGEFVDGACDYLSHIVLYVALATILDDQIGGWAWALTIVSGFSRIAQSNHAETQRRMFLWRVYGVPWLKVSEAGERRVFSGASWLSRGSERVTRAYLWLSQRMAPGATRLDTLAEAAAGDPVRAAEVRRRVHRASRSSLMLQKVLGANPRTIMLGVSMLAGSPLWFFLIEVVGLNAILAVSIRHQNAVDRELLAELA
jgi:phosphatidylglycerophosphate synthase